MTREHGFSLADLTAAMSAGKRMRSSAKSEDTTEAQIAGQLIKDLKAE